MHAQQRNSLGQGCGHLCPAALPGQARSAPRWVTPWTSDFADLCTRLYSADFASINDQASPRYRTIPPWVYLASPFGSKHFTIYSTAHFTCVIFPTYFEAFICLPGNDDIHQGISFPFPLLGCRDVFRDVWGHRWRPWNPEDGLLVSWEQPLCLDCPVAKSFPMPFQIRTG